MLNSCLPLSLKGRSVLYERKGMIHVRTPPKITVMFAVVIHIPYVRIVPIDQFADYFHLVLLFNYLGVIHSFSPFKSLFSFFNILWLSGPHIQMYLILAWSSYLDYLKNYVSFQSYIPFEIPLMFHQQFFWGLSDFLHMVQLFLHFLKYLKLLLNTHLEGHRIFFFLAFQGCTCHRWKLLAPKLELQLPVYTTATAM